ncbi:MAG: cycK [Thermoleophilia bacterium]|nr:cycK [Thermoleophilia bacterium]MCZ4497163.1 cycK [Thermoleophilia bacterium]
MSLQVRVGGRLQPFRVVTLAILGQALLLLALLAAAGGSVLSFVGGRRLTNKHYDRLAERSGATITGDRFADAGARAMHLLMLAASGATLLLLLALVGKDYTLSYVQGRISSDLSLGFRLTSLWAGQEGSLLLWLFVLALCGTLMVRSLRRATVPAALLAHATGVVLTIATFFALLVAVIARPFAVVDQLSRDGAGMSPSLQNYWMAAHPPALYLGYVGVAIPFAIVAGALLARRHDDSWIATTRSWVLFSWSFLLLGLVLGARWAYEEIGWGGYWAWDPVENAALMPWLTATALLHSVMVQQRRGMMKFWNAVLATLTFGLSIFGTFITRSGVLSSVHSFVSSPVGWWFIGALAVLIVCSLVLLYRSRDLLSARHDVDSFVSREALLLFNNLLLVSLALVVLWGVVYPILTAAFTDSRISIEKPWYDFFATAFGLPLIFLLAFAPFIAWRGTAFKRVLRFALVPLGVSLAVGIAMILAGLGDSPAGIAAVSLGVLVIAGVFADFVRSLRAHRAAATSAALVPSIGRVLVRHRRRWGAWIAHAGIGLVVIAVAGSAWVTSTTRELRTGDRVELGNYTLVYEEVERERKGSRMLTRAVFAVSRDGEDLGLLRSGRDFHPASGEVSNEVGIRHDWLRAHDLFVTVDRLTEDGVVRAKLFVNPLVPLLWMAGLITVLGALIAALPDPRDRLRRERDDRNGDGGVEADDDAVHELRNGAPAPR